jgi:hypothetical protein
MIHRLIKVTPKLYRGSAPSPTDVLWLKNEFKIKKIISLDKLTGNKIDRTCKILGIEHIMLPLEPDHFNMNSSLLNFLKHDIKKLLLENGPTYVHCAAGKDRTGFVIALLQCKYLGKTPDQAIEEAKSLGFGQDVDPKLTNTFEKIIRKCKPIKNKDENDADIVSNEREYISDNRDSFLDEGHQGSFAPYTNVTRQNPQDALYNFVNDQSPTRENYKTDWEDKKKQIEDNNSENIPLIGIYNNDAGMYGAGPVFPAGGFLSD